MLKRRNKIINFSLISCLVILAVCWGYVKYNNRKPELPAPTVITEPLATYYIGNVALDIPESWEMSHISAVFYLTDSKNGPEIALDESPLAEGRDAAEWMGKKLELAEISSKLFNEHVEIIEKEDIGESLGRPAVIIVQRTKPKSYRLTEGDDSGMDRLEISLFLMEPQAIIGFKYSENLAWPANEEETDIIAAKRKLLSDWALDFLMQYQWFGKNTANPSGFLSTEYGRVILGDDRPELRYKLTGFFKPKNDANNNPNILSFSLSSIPEQNLYYRKETNRVVGGHPGYERRSVVNIRRKGAERLKFWLPRVAFMPLSWQDISETTPSQDNPRFAASYVGFSETKGNPELADVLGVWDTVLNSVRLTSSSL